MQYGGQARGVGVAGGARVVNGQPVGVPQQQADGSISQMMSVGDGGQDYRAAKRLKPTTKTLPSFEFDASVPLASDRIKQGVDALKQLSESYGKLQQLERKIDWNISKSQIEAAEKIAPPGVRRRFRFHIVCRAKDQAWQSEGEPEPDFVRGKNVPRVELTMTAELLPRTKGAQLTDAEKKLTFADLVKQVTIECDKTPEAGENVGPFEWRKSNLARDGNSSTGGLTINLPTTGVLTFRLAVYPNHNPDLFAVPSDFATLIQMSTGERSELLRALWTFARKNNLIEQGGVRTTEAMKRIFHNQAIVQFHHIPEYLNRYLVPPAPMLLEIKANSKEGEVHSAWDMFVNTKSDASVSPPKLDQAALEQIHTLDEEISAACTRTQSLSRSIESLSSFTANPVEYLEQYTASQSADLGKALGDHELGFKQGWKPKSEQEWQEVVRQARV